MCLWLLGSLLLQGYIVADQHKCMCGVCTLCGNLTLWVYSALFSDDVCMTSQLSAPLQFYTLAYFKVICGLAL